MVLEIQPQHFTFGEMIHGRLFRIPSYQRAYSWQRRQRSDLFRDIRRTWEAGDDRRHFMATIVGLRREKRKIIVDEHQVIDIVDGQQRLTTLILLLKSIGKALDRGNQVGERLGREIDESLVKPDEASLLLLQTNHDSSNYFADYLRNGASPPPDAAATLADRELLEAIRDCERFISSWQQEAPLTDLIALLRNGLTFIFHEIADESLVYTVFEVLNSRGLDVSYVDRLKNLLMATIFESDNGNREELIAEVHNLWGEIYRCIGLRQGMSTEALRFAATLRNPTQPSRTLGEQDAVDVLATLSKSGPSQVIEVTKWLKSVTQAVDDLTSDHRRNAVTSIAQARLLAIAILLRSDLTVSERQKLLRAWETVTFRIYGLLRGDARWAVGDYVRLAWRTVEHRLSADDILESISNMASTYPVHLEDVKGKPWYPEYREELRYFLFRYEEHLSKEAGQTFDNEQWNRIWEASASDSIEHILPQSKFGGEYGHGLGNLILLPPKLNSKLGNKIPFLKRDAYRKTGLLQACEIAETERLMFWESSEIHKREETLLN